MPVIKIPIVHKFGIISHSQRLALQERLLRQNIQREHAATAAAAAHIRANPLEVCEKFVQKYNSTTFENIDHCRVEAERILTHSKRRVGISTQGEGDHVDLPMAWSELAILAQCKGKLQEDCFEVLCKSLNHAPLHEENIPTLFFLAESTLYWLRTDSINNTYLRTAEIRLLKLGFLVFARLYYHHLVNGLAGLGEFKTRLQTYMEGIHDLETLYNSYPGVQLALRFIARVGEVITRNFSDQQANSHISSQSEGMPPILIRPIVYQALHVWRCRDKDVGLKKALFDVLVCAKDLVQEDWIDALFAVSILGDSAKANFTACRSFQDLARGVAIPISQLATPRTTDFFLSDASQKKNSSTNPKKDYGENRETTDDAFQDIISGMIADFDSSIGETPHGRSMIDTATDANTRNKDIRSEMQSKGNRSDIKPNQSSTVPGTSRFTPTTFPSKGSPTPITPRSDVNDPASLGISSWGWEIAYQYCQILADICLHGATASVQKVAMLGKWLDADVTTFRAGVPNFCIESCGLVDLLEYRNPHNNPPQTSSSNKLLSTESEDWSWKIRYGALSSLLHLTHALREDKLKDGMRSAAWSLIVSLQDSAVTEDRVLEAIRVGQVEYPDFNKSFNTGTSLNIWSRISHSLTEHFLLPTLPIPRSPSSLTRHTVGDSQRTPGHSPRAKSLASPVPAKPPSTKGRPSPTCLTLKDQLIIHTSVDRISNEYHKRNKTNLNRIVEDQWRKQLMKEQDESKEKRLKNLRDKQKEEEQRFDEIAWNRKEKLKGKPTSKLLPYELP